MNDILRLDLPIPCSVCGGSMNPMGNDGEGNAICVECMVTG